MDDLNGGNITFGGDGANFKLDAHMLLGQGITFDEANDLRTFLVSNMGDLSSSVDPVVAKYTTANATQGDVFNCYGTDKWSKITCQNFNDVSTAEPFGTLNGGNYDDAYLGQVDIPLGTSLYSEIKYIANDGVPRIHTSPIVHMDTIINNHD